MKQLGRTFLIIVAALLTLQGLTAMAVSPARTSTDGGLAAAAPDREALVREILDLWANAPNPVVGENRTQYGDLRAALRLATVEQLLEARQARTYGDVWAALPKGAKTFTSVVPLAVGQTITPLVLGDAADDLVYTPVTPCRIIDTRVGVAPFTGILGPNSGREFFVAEANYSSQGGFAGSCGIPTSPVPAAVAINVTSTGQTGTGNLRVIENGGGLPNVSLVNYVAGVNIANAAISRAVHFSDGEIFIYSGNSQSHAVVDIMGYFNPPAATPVDNNIDRSIFTNVLGGASFNIFSPACPAGYNLTGGGFQWGAFDPGDVIMASSRPSTLGANPGGSWLCQGTNRSGVTQSLSCWCVCSRVPGH